MKNKKWILWAGIMAAVLVISLGDAYAFNRLNGKQAQGKIQKVSTVHSNSKTSTKKVEKNHSKSSTNHSASKSMIQEIKTVKSMGQSDSRSSQAELKAFNQKAIAEEVYVKVPYGRTMNFERATSEKLKALEKQYTIKEMTNLRDDYDGQTKSVIIFE